MTCRTVNTIDVENPPEGYRLCISRTASELDISVRELAAAADLSPTALFRLTSENSWPVKRDPAPIRAALEALCLERGATPEQMATLWHAYVRNRSRVLANEGRLDPVKARQANPRPQTDKEEASDMLLAKQTLSPAARKAFGLFVNPFDGEVTDDSQMFSNGEIAYVREACLQAAVGGRFVAVVSESGGGKTTMLADLEARIQRDRKPVIVIRPWVLGMEDNDTRGKTLKSTDILASIVTTLDGLAVVPQTLQARSNRARELLTKSTEAGFSHLLVIEEAHSMPEATLKHLKRLHEMRIGRKPLLGILLLGQTELALKLDPRRASLREVTQRCEVVQLLPLDGDLQAYLSHRAEAANRKLGDFIDASGIAELAARLTVTRPAPGGKTRATSLLYPLAVNNLFTAALNTAAELGAPIVTREVVRAV